MQSMHAVVLGASFVVVLSVGCAQRRPACPPAMSPAYVAPALPGAPATQNPADPNKREKLAVLPVEDDNLFRAERQQVRADLAQRLSVIAPEYEVLPLPVVDAELRAVNKSGQMCSFDGAPFSRPAKNKGWRWTELMNVSGVKDRGGELWVQLHSYRREETFAAPWDHKLPRPDAYRAAIAAMTKLGPDDGLVLGLIGGSSRPKGEERQGGLGVCELRAVFECRKESATWLDVGSEISKCFDGLDEASETALIEGTRCELEDLQAVEGSRGKREACVCTALVKSKGNVDRAGRRRVRLSHEALDLAGKPRPELRVIDVSGLFAQEQSVSTKYEEAGKLRHRSVKRLQVDNLDALAAPLARCAVKPGTQLTADLSVDAAGSVSAAHVTSGAQSKPDTICLEKALLRGAFSCPSDDKGITLRLAIRYPSSGSKSATMQQRQQNPN